MNNSLSRWTQKTDEEKISSVEQAIVKLDTSRSQSNIRDLIRILRACIDDGLQFYVPLASARPKDLLEIPKLDLFSREETRPAYRKVEMAKGGLTYCAFTSEDEMNRGEPTEYRLVDMEEILTLAFEDESALGLILNPWGLSILLNKEILSLVLNGDEEDSEQQTDIQSALYIDHSEPWKQDAEVIVSVADRPFDFSEPGPAALLEACSDELLDLCQDRIPPGPGEIVITDAPGLAAEKIFHAALPEPLSEAGCSALISSILSLAETTGVHSIALPAIGSEEGRVDPELPFAVIATAAWFNAHPESRLSVTITCRSLETYQSFVSYLFE